MPPRLNRRDFLRRAARPSTSSGRPELAEGRSRHVVELSCERLYMKYADARSEGRLREFLSGVARDLEGAAEIRLTAREWLERGDFRSDIEPLLRACVRRGAVVQA